MTISFMIPPELKKAIEKLAADEHRSISNYVMLVLLDHVKSKGVDLDKKPKK
ncbi:MAG: hypothetical protein AB1427_08695 [Thermodesulfobacteriota bacterium]